MLSDALLTRREFRFIMPTLDVERTWLEMRRPPQVTTPGAPDGFRLECAEPCPAAWYRYLYAEVGRQWKWVDRLRWDEARLTAHLADPAVSVWVAWQAAVPQGWYELVRHPEDDSMEIAYFGLMPWAIGRGAGRRLLEAAIAEAWRGSPSRIWLHTCTLDHPSALPNYLKDRKSVV